MSVFTPLEDAALLAIFREVPELLPVLQAQRDAATVLSRENDGGGFFTYMSVGKQVPKIASPRHFGRKVNGEMRYLWCAVDQEGEILESFVTRERDKAAALRFMKKALKRHGSPEAITTDGLRSYKAAMTEVGNAV
jgi:putative transposase